MSLDDLVRRADPIRDEPLDFDDAFEALREEIVARPVVARTRPPRRRRWLVPPAVAAVASAVALLVFFLPGDGGTDRPGRRRSCRSRSPCRGCSSASGR